VYQSIEGFRIVANTQIETEDKIGGVVLSQPNEDTVQKIIPLHN